MKIIVGIVFIAGTLVALAVATVVTGTKLQQQQDDFNSSSDTIAGQPETMYFNFDPVRLKFLGKF